jgi:uncharacterized protein (DUF4415 family)
MSSKNPHTSAHDSEDHIPELTEAFWQSARPASEVLPEIFPPDTAASLLRRRGQRGRQKAPTKTSVTLRLDPDVLERFKATGPGWQTRINETLRRAPMWPQ